MATRRAHRRRSCWISLREKPLPPRHRRHCQPHRQPRCRWRRLIQHRQRLSPSPRLPPALQCGRSSPVRAQPAATQSLVQPKRPPEKPFAWSPQYSRDIGMRMLRCSNYGRNRATNRSGKCCSDGGGGRPSGGAGTVLEFVQGGCTEGSAGASGLAYMPGDCSVLCSKCACRSVLRTIPCPVDSPGRAIGTRGRRVPESEGLTS